MKQKRIQYQLSSKIIFILVTLWGCSSADNTLEIRKGKNGQLERITYHYPDKDSISVSLEIENGKVKLIHAGNEMDGQAIWFSPQGGVEQIFNFKKGDKNGHFYSFYESGAMKEHRYLRSGLEVLYGADYFDDSVSIIKHSLHFNDSGQLYFKRSFDSIGNFVSEEGRR